MSSPQLTLYTIESPAALCVPIVLEELGIPYNLKAPSLIDNEHRSEWYLKICPNGRLPALVDHSKEDFVVWESSAILLYIAQHYDTENILSFDLVKEPKLYSEQLQWIFFCHGGLAPMEGQAIHFLRYAPEDVPYGIKRYHDETKRLFSVLEERMNGREWLVGTRYSLADIKTFPWIILILIDLDRWVSKIFARPETYKGMGIPNRWDPNLDRTKEQYRAIGAAYFGFKKVD